MSVISDINWRFKRVKFLRKYKKLVLDKENLDDISDLKDAERYIVEVVLYDVLDNHGFAKMIRELYRCKKNRNYEVSTNYRKTMLKNLNYINPQFDYTSTKSVGKINFKKDNFIREINISSTQINNEEALIVYEVSFNKVIWDFNQIIKFVKENIFELKNSSFVPIYSKIDDIAKKDEESKRITMQLFYFSIQQYIVKNLFSNIGQRYQLPRLTRIVYKEHSEEIDNYLKEPFLECTYKLPKGDNYFVVNNLEHLAGIDITEYIFGDRWGCENLLSIFSEFKMEAYLTFFYSIEVHLLETKISKFLNSKRKSISSKDYKWLLSKLRRVDEEVIYEIDEERYHERNLIGYSSKSKEYFIEPNKYRDRFKIVYKNNLEYLSAIHISNYNTVILITTVVTLILTLISLIL